MVVMKVAVVAAVARVVERGEATVGARVVEKMAVEPIDRALKNLKDAVHTTTARITRVGRGRSAGRSGRGRSSGRGDRGRSSGRGGTGRKRKTKP